MQNIRKVYVVGNQRHYANFIDNIELVDDITSADIVIFTGGEDVDPSLYHCKPHPTTYSNLSRDHEEKAVFDNIRSDQLVIGICRGSQLLWVMNGGKLVQNCLNHAIGYTHSIIEFNLSRIYEITSTHHQMQYPFNIPSEYWNCLFAADSMRSKKYEGDGIEPSMIFFEPEVVLYHRPDKPVCLAIQGHPEYMRKESPIVVRLNEIINELLLKNED